MEINLNCTNKSHYQIFAVDSCLCCIFYGCYYAHATTTVEESRPAHSPEAQPRKPMLELSRTVQAAIVYPHPLDIMFEEGAITGHDIMTCSLVSGAPWHRRHLTKGAFSAYVGITGGLCGARTLPSTSESFHL